MDDARFGTAVRLVRQRKGWRQCDLATRAKVSPSTISRIERGHPGSFSLATIRAIASALDVRVELVARWRAGDLDRMLDARHSALADLVVRWFADELTAWVLAPEVSFSIYGERGVIDILAWHAATRSLVVIELKTDLADINEVLGTLDRKRRLAATVARERGWDPAIVSTWLIVAEGRTNRARLAAHRAVMRAALPAGRVAIQRWLRDLMGAVHGLSSWAAVDATRLTPTRRVRAGGTLTREGGGA